MTTSTLTKIGGGARPLLLVNPTGSVFDSSDGQLYRCEAFTASLKFVIAHKRMDFNWLTNMSEYDIGMIERGLNLPTSEILKVDRKMSPFSNHNIQRVDSYMEFNKNPILWIDTEVHNAIDEAQQIQGESEGLLHIIAPQDQGASAADAEHVQKWYEQWVEHFEENA